MAKLLLYHTGFHERRSPDIRAGRKNADFGQGYYLTPDRDFARRRRSFGFWRQAS